MIGSRIKFLLAAVVLSASAALADDVPAGAPASTPDTATTDTETVPDAPDLPNTTGPIVETGKVAVGDLNVVDGAAAGTLDDASGGLGHDMWVNAPRDDVEQLLTAIPVSSHDSVVRGLARRILLTEADAPVGPGKRALVTIRLEKLLGAGMVSEAGVIAAKVRLPNDSDFAVVQANTILLSGRVSDACGDATNERLNNGDVMWLQLRAYCFAVAGDQTQVDLIDQLLEAQGKSDPAYEMLRDDVLQHLNYMPGSFPSPTPVHVLLLKAARLPVPPDVAARFRLNVVQPAAEPVPVGYVIAPEQLVTAAAAFAPRAQADQYEQRRAALSLALADALGEPLPQDAVKAMATAQTPPWVGSRPSAAEWQKIEDASNASGRRGEAVLRLIVALDARDLGDMAPDASAKFVRLLRQLNLNDEARLLAAHALAAYRDPPPPAATTTP